MPCKLLRIATQFLTNLELAHPYRCTNLSKIPQTPTDLPDFISKLARNSP